MIINDIARKVWHFREFWDIFGWEVEDWEIACDIVNRGLHTNLQIQEYCKKVFHDALQEKMLVEEAELIKGSVK